MSLVVVPLALTMNAGPRIMSAIIFVRSSKPLKLLAYFLTGVVIAVTAGVTITLTLATVFGNSVSFGAASDSGSLGNIIQLRDWMNTNSWLVSIIVYVVFILLILLRLAITGKENISVIALESNGRGARQKIPLGQSPLRPRRRGHDRPRASLA